MTSKMVTLVLIVSNNLRNCVTSKMVTLVLIVSNNLRNCVKSDDYFSTYC